MTENFKSHRRRNHLQTRTWPHHFPQHFFERLVRRLRSRHRKPRQRMTLLRTWYRCYKNNRDKLLYRFQYRFINRNKRQSESPWDAAIWFQKRKIARKHDEILHWAMTEYRILKKMNEPMPQPVRPLLWRFAVSIQVSMINQEHQKRPAAVRKYRLTWNTCVRRFVERNNASRPGSGMWEIAVRANVKKAISLNRASTWNVAIYEQWKRLKRSGDHLVSSRNRRGRVRHQSVGSST